MTPPTFELRGALSDARYWLCPLSEGGGEPRFVESERSAAAIVGTPLQLRLRWEGAEPGPADLLAWLSLPSSNGDRTRGFFSFEATLDDNPLPLTLHVSPEASTGDFLLNLAFALGGRAGDEVEPGDALSVPLTVVPPAGGDIEIELQWRTATDLDLHVFAPGDEEIYFASPVGAAGGELTQDSRGDCERTFSERPTAATTYRERVVWPAGRAPAGGYRVEAHLFDTCETYAATPFRVLVVLGDQRVIVADGEFPASLFEGVREAVAFEL